MVADGTDVRGLGADHDVAAVGALPDAVALAGEDEAALDVGEEPAVALFVLLLDLTNHLKLERNLLESFLAGLLGHAGIHVRPLEVLTVRGVRQVLHRGTHLATMKVLVPNLGMFFLVGRRLLEDLGDLDIAILLGLAGEEGILVSRLGFASEGFQEVLFGF